jgi:hypothetical protein
MKRVKIIWITGLFFLCSLLTANAQTMVRAEYFIDVEPGAGKGKEIPLTPGGQVDIVTEIDTEGLASGFHILYVRLKDDMGHWSLVEGRPFFIDEKTGSLATVVAGEYYFDEEDPGQGKGTPLAIASGPQIELEKQVDISGLALGKHRLNLRFQDNKGAWGYAEIQEFTIAIPKVDAISPASGGNIGKVTVNILGASFDEGTVVKLTGNGQPDLVVPDSMIAIINGEQIRATLDLKGKAEGLYNVVVTLANGTVLTLPNSFTVMKGIEAAPWVEVLGFDVIRRGQWQTYTITYGNKGNMDAKGVPLNIIIGLDTRAEVKFDFELLKPSSYGEDFPFDSISVFFNTDNLFGERYVAKVYPLFISNIPGNSVNTMTIQIKTNNDIELLAYTDAPYFNEQTLKVVHPDAPFYGEIARPWFGDQGSKRRAPESDFNTNAKGCLSAVLDIVVDEAVEKLLPKLAPGVSCFISGYELTGEIIDWKQGNGEATRTSALWKLGSAFQNCAMDLLPAGKLWTLGTIVFKGIMQAKEAESCTNFAHQSFGPLRRQIKKIRAVNSFDPNDKLGSAGIGPKNFVFGDAPFRYLIRFENKASATAAAQTVRIVDTLDITRFDLSTLELGYFNFADRYVHIPPGRRNYTGYVDLRPEQDLIVKIEGKLDESTGVLTWLYTSLDPATRMPTQNPLAGFLPPNKIAPEGDGGVFYTIRPKDNLITNDDIRNKAYIYFDNNDVIPTPTWSNSIDKLPPASKVKDLAQQQSNTTFKVDWSGTDAGSGIDRYSIYVAVNDQPYKLWLRNVTETSAMFIGRMDSTYHFYSIAKDSTGIAELPPVVADASTIVSKITGIEDDIEKQVIVFPNPAHHTLMVELPGTLRKSKLSLINVHGREVLNLEAKDTSTSISVNHLAKGMYLLRIANENFVTTKKVLLR